jgi:O-Antigen ligase
MISEPVAGAPPAVKHRILPPLLPSAALVAAVAVGVIAAAAWPTVAVALALVVVISVLAWRAPSIGFLGALLVSGGVGLLKARLSADQMSSPDTVGALIVDVLLLISFVGLLASDRGRSLRSVWRAGGRAERVVWTLLLAWLLISILQIPESGHLTRGIKGFRLTQAYVPVVLGGVALFPVARDREALIKGILIVFAVVSGYAALRAAIGPATWERTYALTRSGQAFLSGIFRDVGSFNTPQDMASFVAPAGVFALILGVLNPRVRTFALLTFLLCGVAVVESYVRTAIVAMGIGVAVLALLVLLTNTTPRYLKIAAVASALVVAGAGYGGALAAGGASHSTAVRAAGLSHPFTDPSIETRWRRWKRAARAAVDHPLGTGLGTVGSATGSAGTLSRFATGTYTDNSYLKVLDEQGIPIGLLFIVGVIGSAVLIGRELVRAGPLRRPVAVAALGGFVAFFTLCFLGDYIEWPGKILAWTLLGIAVWDVYGTKGRRPEAVDAAAS